MQRFHCKLVIFVKAEKEERLYNRPTSAYHVVLWSCRTFHTRIRQFSLPFRQKFQQERFRTEIYQLLAIIIYFVNLFLGIAKYFISRQIEK